MRLEGWLYLEADRKLIGKVYGHPQLADGSQLTIHDAVLDEVSRKASTLSGEIELGISYVEQWGEADAWPLGGE